jgi:hypothetical protein
VNVAFPAFLLFLFLIPGFVLRASFRTLEGSQVDAGPFAASSIKSVIYAMALHLIAWWVVEKWTAYTVHWDALLALFIGDKTKETDRALGLIARHPVAHVMYFFLVIALAAIGGYLLRQLVTWGRFDRIGRSLAPLFRSGTEWYYLFTGYDEDVQPDFVFVTALVELDETYLYRGVYERYFLKGDGELDRVVLTGVDRRKMSSDKEKEGEENPAFYPIDGDYFVLRYAEMITMNVYYFWAVPEEVDERNSGLQGVPS